MAKFLLKFTATEDCQDYKQAPYTPEPNRSPFEVGIGQTIATPLVVGDAEGVWLKDYFWGDGPPKTAVTYNVLIWLGTTPDGDSFLFWLGSEARLPLAEMLQIAELLAPVAD